MLRSIAAAIAAIEATVWAPFAGAAAAEAFAGRSGGVTALVLTVAFAGLTLPALVLVICNWRNDRAAILAGIALPIYAYAPFALGAKATGPIFWLAILLAALVLGCAKLWNSGPPKQESAPAPTWDDVMPRFVLLLAAGFATMFWFFAFIPAIKHTVRRTGDGFEIIPAFYGTIMFLIFVVPVIVVGVRGAAKKSPELQFALAAMVLLLMGMVGVPLFLAALSGK
ncbi:MAG: hypothetical protein FJX62_07675 [Alphaproteobacteria bacterium]|nr:hypothetical protein [Alphaproteobacteria bacterium]